MSGILLVLMAITLASAKIFEKCELADVLENKHNVKRDQIKTWVCIANHRKSFNTQEIISNEDGSKVYGLFEINNKLWCEDNDNDPSFNNICNMPCSSRSM
ncbi:unnamed protein product, partial [Meganyctiphanes norvegica]